MESIDDKSHLAIVEEILYDGAEPTDEQHLTVIAKELDGDPEVRDLQTVMNYAQENISDTALLHSARLQISGKALDGIEEITYYRDDSHSRQARDANEHRAEMVLEVASDVLLSAERVDAATLSQAFAQVKALEPTTSFVHRYENSYSREYANGEQPGVTLKVKAVYSRIASKIKDPDLQQVIAPEFGLKTRIENLILGFITIAQAQDNPSAVLGMPLYDTYKDRVGHCSPGQQELYCVDKSMDHLDAEDDKAFETCMDLMSDSYGMRGLSTPKLLGKVLETVRVSSRTRETTTTIVKSRFGFKREVVESQPSEFEMRRDRLREFVNKNFFGLLEETPDFIKQVTELYPEDGEEGQLTQTDLWQSYGKALAAFGFKNGHYSREKIKELPSIVKNFSTIAPSEIIQDTRETMRERLTVATAA